MDNMTKEKRSYIMSKIRSVSALEHKVKDRLKGNKLRHQPKGIFGNPDYANKTKRIAVFVNGCYWHQPCPKKCSKVPQSNVDFWVKKFKDNRLRQRRAVKQLIKEGWYVGVIWECDPDIVMWRRSNGGWIKVPSFKEWHRKRIAKLYDQA